MSSSSDRSSRSPSPEPVTTKAHKTKSKGKDKGKHKESAHGKNEGVDKDWAYTPPAGSVLADHTVDASEFDWDALKTDEENLELWIVRVPDGVKTKHLKELKLDVPSSSKKTARIGSIERKHGSSYDVWSLGEDENENVGGDEIRGLTCLVPRMKKGGKLYQAPTMTTRHIIISARPTLPTPDPSSGSSSSSLETSPVLHQNPPRHSYPKELLKHKFMPTGSLAPTEAADENRMDVDQEEDGHDKKVHVTEKVERSGEKVKKRKVDASSPKKSKKAKTSV